MHVGRYAGVAVDKLPLSYCRWMLTQDFPREILEWAEKKVKASAFNGDYINVSRHALDMFSLRFMPLWVTDNSMRTELQGLSTFVAKMAQEAWERGVDRSKRRHQHDGTVKEFGEVLFVFGVNPDFPDYKELITVMPVSE